MSHSPRARAWIDALGLERHPEGGWYRETHRDSHSIGACCLPRHPGGSRAMSTAIYYLLAAGDRSRLHRIRSDEVWHHYDGGVLELHLLDEAGGHRVLRLGTDPASDVLPQAVVPGGTWFGALPAPGVEFVLVGCTVAPGFDFRDFQLARAEQLQRTFPEHEELIHTLTPSPEGPGGRP